MRDVHAGQRCFIMGNGPSLRDMDLAPLAAEHTFGLNRIYLAFEHIGFRPTYYASVNRLVLEQCARDITGLCMPKFIAWRSRDSVPFGQRTVYLHRRAWPHFSKDPRLGIWEGATVTYVAIQLAYWMGFAEVYLIGVDHSFKTKGEAHKTVVSQGADPDHFDAAYFGKGFRWQLPDLPRSERAYALARTAFEADGRIIANATVGGKLETFERVDFSSLFEGA